MKKEKRLRKGIMMLVVITCMLPLVHTVIAKTAGTEQPTRTEKLVLGESAERNESEGWEWEPEAKGGGTLTLTDCYIRSDDLQTLYFGNIAEGHTITIVLKGKNIIETTSQKYGGMIGFNYYDGYNIADVIIREEGEGSLEVRTSEPITTGDSPCGFISGSLKVESGSISSNVEICLLTGEFLMQGGSLVVHTPERIDNVFGIVSVAGPINIKGGTVDIVAGHIGIITNGERGEGWSVNISGGDVRIKARQSCIQMQNRRGLPDSRVINITGGTFTGESDITGLYADDINIVKEGENAPRVTIHLSGDSENPNIKAIHAIKELVISDSIVVADTICNYDTSSKENSVVFQGGNGQVYGEVILDSNLEIPDGGTLTIPEDAVLTIPENITLNVPEGASLVNDGILALPENSGNISCSGTGLIKKGEEIYTSEFVKLYAVIIETADGKVTKYYKEGDPVELTPETAPKGKRFKEWKITPDTVALTGNQFLMPASAVTVIPVYEDISYEIEVISSLEEGGTVTGGGKAKEGDPVTVSAAVNSGYVFIGWLEDGQEVSTDAEYTFTASADRTLTACFKKRIPGNAPEKNMQVKNTIKTVAEVKLPVGWSFDEDLGEKTIPAGGTVVVTARYAAEDAEDYDTTSVDIIIKRDDCEEASTVAYNGTGERTPNCTAEGIGHTECKLCGDIVRKDVRVPAVGHTAGETVIKKAVSGRDGSITSHCTVCNATISQTVIDGIGDVRLKQTSGVYNGKIQNPSVTVKDRKGNELKQDVDYVVMDQGAVKNVGIYSVKITFQGNYEGTADLDYTIIPKGTSISKIKAKRKVFSIKWRKQTRQTTGYEIQYSTNKKFTKKTTKRVTIKKNKTTSKSVIKTKSAKRYYVRIRTYKTVRVNGKNRKLTSGWSKVKTVKTKK